MLQKILYSFIVLFVVGVLFFFRAEAGSVISIIRFWKQSFLDRAYNYEDWKNLLKENEILKAKLSVLDKISQPTKNPHKFQKITADVFSHYPFNDRNIVVINAGAADGIAVGMPVLGENDVIFGKITAVRRTQSLVQTIFDPNWKSTVSVGASKTKALFTGGAVPKIDLIPLDVKIAKGDAVFNISPELPLKYLIGTVEEISKSSDGSWMIGTISAGINLELIESIAILTDFP